MHNPTGRQWQNAGDHFVECGPNSKTLPPGAYKFHKDWQQGVIAERIPIKTEYLIKFKDSAIFGLIEEIEQFWRSKPRYDQFNLAWRRGFLLSGDPGNGKSGIVQMVARDVIADGGIVAMISDPKAFLEAWPHIFKSEYNSKMVIIMEDIESILGEHENSILELLDGASDHKPGVVYIATTNNLAELPERIRNRPSRFDTVVEIGYPSAATRRDYIEHFVTDKEQSNKLAKISDGLSLAHVKELIISTQIYDYDAHETAERLGKLGKVEKKTTSIKSKVRVRDGKYDSKAPSPYKEGIPTMDPPTKRIGV